MAKKRKSRASQPSTEEPEPQEQTLPMEDPQQEQQEQEEEADDVIEDEQAVPDDEEEPQEEEEEEVEEEEPAEQEEEENNDVTDDVIKPEEEDDEDDEDEPVEKLLEPFSKEQLLLLLKEAVSKHPELISSVEKIADADPAHRKIFVHGLGWDTNSDLLISEFGRYGEIEDCKAVVDKVSGKSKGYAFILFKHRSGAQKALKEPQKKIGNRMTSCQLASAGPVPAFSPAVSNVSEYTQRKIFVSNVAADIDPGKLTEFFAQFGEIDDGPLGLDKQTGKPRGFALFVYKSVESAKKALEEPHKIFEGHTLNVQKAVDGPKQGKSHFQQPHQFGGGSGGGGNHYPSKKGRYGGGGGHGGVGVGGVGVGGGGHLMAPSGPSYNQGGVNPALTPALGQALTALLATQGAGLGNLLGLGGPPQGMPGGYGNQGYGGQQGGYPNPQGGQGGNRQQGGAPYMGHGR